MTATIPETLSLRKPFSRPASQTGSAANTVTHRLPHANVSFVRTLSSLAVAITEVLNGMRSHTSIARWLTPTLLDKVRNYAAVRQSLAREQRSLTFWAGHEPRLCIINEKTVEATVVVRSHHRARAVAMRLELHNRHWLVTELVTI